MSSYHRAVLSSCLEVDQTYLQFSSFLTDAADQRKEHQKRSERVQRHWGCGRSLEEPVRGRKQEVWSHGELQSFLSFLKKLLPPHPYHRTFRRVPIPLVAYEDKYEKNFSPSPALL